MESATAEVKKSVNVSNTPARVCFQDSYNEIIIGFDW